MNNTILIGIGSLSARLITSIAGQFAYKASEAKVFCLIELIIKDNKNQNTVFANGEIRCNAKHLIT